MDLQLYYQRMAEDYRQKFLEIEKEYNHYRLNKDHELRREREEVEKKVESHYQQQLEEQHRIHKDVVQQKDYQINLLKNQIQELEIRVQKEAEQIHSL